MGAQLSRNRFYLRYVQKSTVPLQTWPGCINVTPENVFPNRNRFRSVIYRVGDEDVPGPGAPSMYRAFLAYLYSVACNLFEIYKDYDPEATNILPLRLELHLLQ